MPLKYYCDFCDKSFLDSPAARRRHVRGASHQRIRTQWYATFEKASEVPDAYVGADRCARHQSKEEGGNQKSQTKEEGPHQQCDELLTRGLCSRGSFCPFVSSHSGIVASGAASMFQLPCANEDSGESSSCLPPSLQVSASHPESIKSHISIAISSGPAPSFLFGAKGSSSNPGWG
ncbi:hypothetical protein CLOM_g19534 [Closterium sp. NIES-68]|nr:hypothetical protein CLOM_g19534 [Closterium sp. NIES-68]GJP71817.1 hypothetical protein CLOP_g2608 [Closterium sp. NIES-67]